MEVSQKHHRTQRNSGQTATPVLSAEFLNRHTSKNDLVRRLRKVGDALADEDVEPNSPDYPGLGGLAAVLVEDKYLKHRDKEVRLYTVLACIEILYLYAPDPPYDATEILKIFPQVIQQIANLATCTSPSQPNFSQYFRLLEQLAVVNIGVVLVEMTKTLDSAEVGDRSDNDDPTSEDALEVLRELIEVLLNCVHIDHPSDVLSHAITAISGCIVEFDGGAPIPILDEILKCIGAGPFVDVTNPAFTQAVAELSAAKKSGSKKQPLNSEALPPMYIQETNQSYLVARGVISKTVDRISSPIASLLNGLLSGEPNVIKQSNISSDLPPPIKKGKGTVTDLLVPEQVESNSADVWTIIYELHKVSSGILTTVVGTVASSLQHSDEEKRLRVANLLGKLFSSRSSDIAVKFHVCYRSWLLRVSDKSSKIREVVVRHLIDILKNKSTEKSLCEEAVEGIEKVLSNDPSVDIRLECIHEICSMIVYGESSSTSGPFINDRLVKALASRVCSKNKKERTDSITGLAKIYHKKYLIPKVSELQRADNDFEIENVTNILKDNCDFGVYCAKEQTSQRSKRKRSSLSSTKIDTDECEKYKFIPRLVFQSVCFNDSTDPALRNRIVMIVDDVLLGTGAGAVKSKDEKSKRDNLSLTARAVGLTMIMNDLYSLDDENGNENAGKNSVIFKWLVALMQQRRKLQLAIRAYIESRAKFEACDSGSEVRDRMHRSAFQKLEIVASLTSPTSALSSPGTTIEGLEKILPKVHGAKDKHIFRLLASIANPGHSSNARSRALDELPKRTKSLGSSTSAWIKTLARRCAMGYFMNSEIITHCASMAQEAFNEGEYLVCRALLESVNIGVNLFPSMTGKDASESLTELFAECRGSLSSDKKRQIKEYGILTTLSEMLAYVSKSSPSKDGEHNSPSAESVFDEQIKKELVNLCTKDGTEEEAFNAVITLSSQFEKGSKEQLESFLPIMKTLTSSSKMTLEIHGSPNKKIINILTALRAIALNVPDIFSKSVKKIDPGSKAVRFTLDSILLGRGRNLDDSQGDDESNVSDAESEEVISQRHHSKSSPKRKSIGSDKESLSFPCLRLIKAIEFLVSYIFSTSSTQDKSSQNPISSDVLSIVQVLLNILEDDGLPPSSRDHNDCKGWAERAALRKCAAVNFLQLCSGSLRLADRILTPTALHTLSKAFVDEEISVRDAAMTELCSLLKAEGPYMKSLPKLSLLALVCLCPDSESHVGTVANGFAAHVGRKSTFTKEAALKCVNMLRSTSNNVLLQYRAADKENIFESKVKMMLMPEFCVPYAFHLLVMRPETPATYDKISDDNEEAKHKMLQKRLKWLYDPLVLSLGDGADNISFLLRQAELLGTKYNPLTTRSECDSDTLSAKLKVISSSARDILLKLVKKDVNLTTYPGSIQIPGSYFALATARSPTSLLDSTGSTKPILSPPRIDENNVDFVDSGKKSVHFQEVDDDEVSFASSTEKNHSRSKRSRRNNPDDFNINLSPIAQSDSPASSARSGSQFSHRSKRSRSSRTPDVKSMSSKDESIVDSPIVISRRKSRDDAKAVSDDKFAQRRKQDRKSLESKGKKSKSDSFGNRKDGSGIKNKENVENFEFDDASEQQIDVSKTKTTARNNRKSVVTVAKSSRQAKYKQAKISPSVSSLESPVNMKSVPIRRSNRRSK